MTLDALVARTSPAFATIVVGAVCWGLSPWSLTRLLAVLAAGIGVAAAAAPGSALATVTVLLLAGEYAAATSSTHGMRLLASAVGFAIGLWAVHQLYAFAAVVPRDAAVDRSAIRRLTARIAATAALTAPVVVVLLVVADAVPSGAVVRAVGVAAAAFVALLPTYVVRRRQRDDVSRRA
jgi:hypothetical protein